jgi:hypothetical protein
MSQKPGASALPRFFRDRHPSVATEWGTPADPYASRSRRASHASWKWTSSAICNSGSFTNA